MKLRPFADFADFADFRTALAAALAAFPELSARVGDVETEDELAGPLDRAFREIRDPDADDDYRADVIHDAVFDVVAEYNNPWNYPPGRVLSKLDPREVALVAVGGLFGRDDAGRELG